MTRYSYAAIARNALGGHTRWTRAWRRPERKPAYDIVIIGAGGHGLATAYSLARVHGLRSIAVIEKGRLGLGNVARNTAIVRSNYLLDANGAFYEFSLKLWESLSRELNFNVMFSARGIVNLAHTEAQLEAHMRRGNAMRMRGVDAEILDRGQIKALLPRLDVSGDARFPIVGGLFQPRAGIARHDAVAWGYARAASALGVDILEEHPVTGIRVEGGRVRGVETTRGTIAAERVGIAVAGHTSRVAAMAGLRLPIESHVLQAFVTEPLKPVLNTVVTSGASHIYTNQTDKGEIVFGGDIDGYNSYARRGNLPVLEHVTAGLLALFPSFGRLRLMRSWGGIMDMTMDGSPIIAKTPIEGLYLNGGWCYGGFKATPASGWTFAHTIANDAPHALNAPFSMERFASGATLDEAGGGPFPWVH